jgi:hypothetical protein
MQHDTGLPARLRSWANVQTAIGTLLAGLVLAAVYIGMVAPWLRDHMGGEKLLDEMFWRTPAEPDTALEAYGPDGRDFYRNVLLVDLFFPIVYSVFLALSVAFAAPKIPRLRPFANLAPLLPIAGGMFDWGENILFLTQLSRFPDQGDFLSWAACVMTFMKFAALGLSVAIIAWGLWSYRQGSKEPLYRSNHHSR